jgi:hypothetical protein
MQGISLLIISLDRFLGTVYPTYYYKFDVKYAWRMILGSQNFEIEKNLE